MNVQDRAVHAANCGGDARMGSEALDSTATPGSAAPSLRFSTGGEPSLRSSDSASPLHTLIHKHSLLFLFLTLFSVLQHLRVLLCRRKMMARECQDTAYSTKIEARAHTHNAQTVTQVEACSRRPHDGGTCSAVSGPRVLEHDSMPAGRPVRFTTSMSVPECAKHILRGPECCQRVVPSHADLCAAIWR